MYLGQVSRSTRRCTLILDYETGKMQLKKKTNADKKPNPYPDKATLWAYYMQAIEPTSEEINKTFPEYHPLWIQQSQKIKPSGEQLSHYREYCLGITQAQCASYLRISIRQIKLWELNKQPVPFIVFELLRLVHESVHFRLSHKDWNGWFVNEQGRLVCPDRGNLSFDPLDLTMVREVQNANRVYLHQYQQLQREVAPLKAEIEALKKVSYANALLGELSEIEHKLSSVLKKMTQADLHVKADLATSYFANTAY